MPEPDFDQIARIIVDRAHAPDGEGTGTIGVIMNAAWRQRALCTPIAEQLRQVWNARGAADVKTIEEEQWHPDGWGHLMREIKELDCESENSFQSVIKPHIEGPWK